MAYCASRFRTVRRPTREVRVGSVGVGGTNPIRVQSMTTSDTQDIEATVRQSIALAEVGCEIVRITAPNVQAAKCLKEIRARFTAAGFGAVPLVADIHFLPQAAMEAVEHVEKVRVNPGNYADKKRFAVREYSDADYDRELQRLHDAFSPLVKRCKELGRAMRIGTNHGSLSDRIMNRYGDTPLGMVESALEFLRICEAHDFREIILSMKASNPKVMIEAYRMLVERMSQEDMHYPLHLGVTEAGDGEDGRIKGAIGIGSLLMDGLGDTIRVSLTEDSVYEIPVAQALARLPTLAAKPPQPSKAPATPANPAVAPANPEGPGVAPAKPEGPGVALAKPESPGVALAKPEAKPESPGVAPAKPEADPESLDPFHFTRRATTEVALGRGCGAGGENVPRVIVRATLDELRSPASAFFDPKREDTPAEGALLAVASAADVREAMALLPEAPVKFLILDLTAAGAAAAAEAEAAAAAPRASGGGGLALLRRYRAGEAGRLRADAAAAQRSLYSLICDIDPAAAAELAPALPAGRALVTWSGGDAASRRAGDGAAHPLGQYRQLAAALRRAGAAAPLWIRATAATAVRPEPTFLSRLLEASVLAGGLLADGLGDLLSVETEPDTGRALRLAYNILQGAGARISKTEFVACPSCGRTLFDLQATTQRIRAQTGHLKGVKLAIMGCIVNGPGEMADADFGYVGGAPGKINLYVGKNCVQYNVPQAEADARLIALIKEHGRWIEPGGVSKISHAVTVP
ncbi:MAG TPA: (E)-4-hydroxy-3-methylbut-2-enyl-diphosphate synthase [Opitutaceae bacterium]|jgi:(E)-4-hydroxy-3-methylbut-2-enyl-diphosphate synthase|nr:(E)-4-hydroxy-3-methylbut-2-enyl-diphosphate synthase [Opitutaceae bacterium]